MSNKNDITGDTIISKVSNSYRDNYDSIFRKDVVIIKDEEKIKRLKELAEKIKQKPLEKIELDKLKVLNKEILDNEIWNDLDDLALDIELENQIEFNSSMTKEERRKIFLESKNKN